MTLPLNGHSPLEKRQLNIVSGGTDLYVQKADELKDKDIYFLYDDPLLKGISQEGRNAVLGASVTVTELAESPLMQEYFPGLAGYIRLISSTPIRNMATIAGNFINASPIGDLTIFFLALNAQLTLTDGEHSRELPLRKLFRSYKTLNKNPGEYIEKIWFELPSKNSLFNFEKVSKRTCLDIASVNSAISMTISDGRILNVAIAAGGVAPVPLYLEKTSVFLSGKLFSEELIIQATELAQTEISPISDTRGSEDYKRLLLSQLIKAHFIILVPELEVEALLGS
jgi:xanthine dehydrogenase small subunit